jgi:hypothetical protein
MPTPQIKEEKDPGVQLLGRLALSLVLWAGTLIAAYKILEGGAHGFAIRAGAIGLAMAGFLPWVWMVSRAIVAEDEFTRRIHFIALSWAFAATGVFVVGADLFVRAHFVDYVAPMTIWMFMIVVWWVSIMLTARYYR